jgi:hypothetical protein
MKDITGQKFGKLTAVKLSHQDECGKYIWDCVCDCGREQKAWVSSLTRGKRTRCEECRCPNLIGKRFGRGVVIDKASNRRESRRQEWILKCDCGNLYQTTTVMLRGRVGHRTRSCGCYSRCTGEGRWNYQGYVELSGTFWNIIVQSSKARGIELNITRKQAYEKFLEQEGRCALTGIELKFEDPSIKGRTWLAGKTASLDRIDSSKPYTVDNIQWLHKHVNLMKNSHTQEYYIEICRLVVEHSSKRKEV